MSVEITYRLTDSSAGDVYTSLQKVPWDNTHEVVIRGRKSKRSLEQNALWHKQINHLSKVMGYTPAEMKCIVKYSLGYYHEVEGKATTLLIYDDTHTMSVDELSVLIDQTIEWAADKGVCL